MKLACSSYSYHDELEDDMTLEEFFEICSTELEIAGVELLDDHLPGDDTETIDHVADLLDEYDLEIACLSVFYNDFAKASGDERRADVKKVKKWLDHADRLGAPILRGFTGFPGLHDRDHDDPEVWTDVATCMQECVDYGHTVETTFAIENHNHDGLIRTADDIFRVRGSVNGELGLVLDLANYIDGEPSVNRTLHLADHVHAAYDDLADDGSEPNYPFYRESLAALKELGYDGFVTLEYEGDESDFEAVPAAVEYLKSCL